MARQQVLVQFDDELVALLDERAAALGISRSELLRRWARAALAEDITRRVDEAIATGYGKVPDEAPDALLQLLAIASIEAEPW